ncbi:MAG: replication initiator protein A [Firmicutes bacterium]|nr:replication initiator protein A [Bacillota bacterium]
MFKTTKPENYYFYGKSNGIKFYQMPNIIMDNPKYNKISDSAKILYMLLFNRMSLSFENGVCDDKGRTYIHYSNEKVMEKMNIGKTKAAALFSELVQIGLIEKVRVLGRPSRIYVLDYNAILEAEGGINTNSSPNGVDEKQATEDAGVREPQENITDDRALMSQTTATDGDNLIYNNINTNNNISTNHTYQDRTGGLMEYIHYSRLIRKNIDYDALKTEYNADKMQCVIELAELITEVVALNSEPVKIKGNLYPAEVVKSRFLKINKQDIERVINWLFSPKFETGAMNRIHNTRAYMIAMLYNPPCGDKVMAVM